jgi:hypothetical protein
MVGLLDEGQDAAPAGLKGPALGVGEAGEVGAGELLEGVLQEVQAGGGVLGGLSECRRALFRPRRLGGAGIAQEGLPRGAVRDGVVGGEERGGLAGGEGVAADHLGQLHLLALGAGTEGERRGHREASVVEAKAERGSELSGEGEAALDPSALLAEQLSDGRDGQAVVVDERTGNVGLVHRPDRAGRRVGGEEPRLQGDARGLLDDDGDLLAPVGHPDHEALEAVDHLVDAVAGGSDADGERRQERPRVAPLAAEAPERSTEPVHEDVLHQAHRGSSRGRSWKSG